MKVAAKFFGIAVACMVVGTGLTWILAAVFGPKWSLVTYPLFAAAVVFMAVAWWNFVRWMWRALTGNR
jgi:hypothetical protein